MYKEGCLAASLDSTHKVSTVPIDNKIVVEYPLGGKIAPGWEPQTDI